MSYVCISEFIYRSYWPLHEVMVARPAPVTFQGRKINLDLISKDKFMSERSTAAAHSSAFMAHLLSSAVVFIPETVSPAR
ncbi:hypothetical protein DPMN_135906 [Dreissena polymorpha]|uniref:Uncharacterized protein n=1 Tax=Dreissena polymorpha TaxID=45954 RepID=A0A9D4JC53_DREPO|nr:hypothetical protein DPMN_135906 [Dreissena polymorpha]